MSTKPRIQEHSYFRQAGLMLEVLPAVAEESCFALKGGTAINFFVRDMPRLSVDIDLTYLPIEDRSISLSKINDALKRIAGRVRTYIPNTTFQEGLIKNTKVVVKLYISNHETQVIVEPNLTLRGTVFESRQRRVCTKVAEHFGASVSIAVVSDADLYGGKICATLDRQHPRDLYDIKVLLENEGLTDEIRKAFLVYLCGHDETMSQLLDPPRKDITSIYESQFVGMVLDPVPLNQLLEARENLITTLHRSLSRQEREFLISMKQGEPKWELLGITGADQLPAIQWKLKNIKQMQPAHHKKSIERLAAILKI